MTTLSVGNFLLSLLTRIYIFFLLTSSSTPFDFEFTIFHNDTTTLVLEGDAAYIDDKFLRLTQSEDIIGGSVGRVTYYKPFCLWNSSTNETADFTSNFTFFIESANDSRYGDGLAFFIASNGSSLNRTLGRGSSLGLPVDSQGNVRRNLDRFVAVEFDISHNGGTAVDDPAIDHVGIDINSIRSIITNPWNGSVLEENGNRVRINYNSSTKVLYVSYISYDNSGIPDTKEIHHTVDLQQYLPEWVIVGFSASTGTQTALHKLNTWSFNSTLVLHRSSPKTGNGINVGLVVGSSIGGCIIILVSGLALVRFRFWKKKEQVGESDGVEDPMELNDSIDEDFERATGPRKFTYNELAHATGNFEEGEKLGEGGFGEVYRGFIKDLNSYVAVKK